MIFIPWNIWENKWYVWEVEISATTKLRPSLVYCLFPVPVFSNNRGGQEVIIEYANEPMQSVSKIDYHCTKDHCQSMWLLIKYSILESFTDENICEFRGFWNDHECFLVTIFYLVLFWLKTCIVDSHRHLIALFKYFKCEKSWDYLIWPHGPQSKMVPSMLIKEPGCQTRSRLPEKLAKCVKTCVHHTSYMPGNTTRKGNIYIYIYIYTSETHAKCASNSSYYSNLLGINMYLRTCCLYTL